MLFAEISGHWPIIVNLLTGSLVGAYVEASWATRLRSETLYKIIAVLLLVIAGVLLFAHGTADGTVPPLTGAYLIVAGVVAGFIIGVLASLLGVAGREFLIPTLILLFGADVKLAGSLSLAVSLPTMLVGFARYSRDQSFSVLRANWPFMIAMAAGVHRRLASGHRAEFNSAAGTGCNLGYLSGESLATRVRPPHFATSFTLYVR